MDTINKLTIYLGGSLYLDGTNKLKIKTYDVEKHSARTVTIVDGKLKVRRKRSEINVVLEEHKNNTFDSISFYAFCEDDMVEIITEALVTAATNRFKELEIIYNSCRVALDGDLKLTTSV